MRLARERSTHL